MIQRTSENPYRRSTTKLDENLDLQPVVEQAKFCLGLIWQHYFQERGVTRKEFDSKPPYYSFDPLQRMGQWILRGYIDLPTYAPHDFPFFELFELPKNLPPDSLYAERMRKAMEAFEKKRYAPEAKTEFERRLKAFSLHLNHYPEVPPESVLLKLKKKYPQNQKWLDDYLAKFSAVENMTQNNFYEGMSDALRALGWLRDGLIDFKDEFHMNRFLPQAKEGYHSIDGSLQFWMDKAFQRLGFEPNDPQTREEFEDDLFDLGFVVVKYPPFSAKK